MAKIVTKKPAPAKKEKPAAVGSFTDRLVKRFNDERTVAFKNVDSFGAVGNWISTGSPSLDFHLNTLGYPTGIIEVRGVSKSGKTTLSLHAIRNACANDPHAIVVILSSERRDNKPYAKQIGVPVSRVIVHQVENIEDVYNKVQQTITQVEVMWKEEEMEGKPTFLFVWDSLGATISAAEQKKMALSAEKDDVDVGNATMATAAKANKRGMRYIVGQVYNRNICFYIINHSYPKIGSFIPGRESYGGEAIQYMPTLRLEATYTGHVKIGKEKIGQTTDIGVIKSDYTSSLDKHEIEIGYGLGLILTEADMKFGLEGGYVTKNGKTGYSFMNGKLAWGDRRELYSLYEQRNKFLEILVKRLTRTVHEKVLAARKLKEEEEERG